MPFSIKDYTDREKIGEGTGSVFSAVQQSLNRKVALKKITLPPFTDTSLLKSIERETRSAGSLDHFNIIRLYDFGENNGPFYISMEYIDGYTLEELLSWRQFPKELALLIVLQMLKGLDFAHKRTVSHCNIKPTNILVSKTGRVVLTDFGSTNSVIHASNRTALKKPEPYPAYIPPEQIIHIKNNQLTFTPAIDDTPVFSDAKPSAPVLKPIDSVHKPELNFRTDLWSVGIILYRILAGKLPFFEQNPKRIVPAEESRTLKIAPSFPEDLAQAIDTCLSPDPIERPASLEPVIVALQNFIVDFGIHEEEATIQRYLADKTAMVMLLEKMATDYHIRKGNEFLALGNTTKSNAHFTIAKRMVFDPSKNDEPIVLFPGKFKKSSSEQKSGAYLFETIAKIATSAKKIIGSKTFLRVIGAIAVLSAASIGIALTINFIKHTVPKNEALFADIPQNRPVEHTLKPETPKPDMAFSKNYQPPQTAASGNNSSWNNSTGPGETFKAVDSSPIDSSALEKKQEAGQPGLFTYGTLIAAIDPPTAYIFIDKSGVPREELTVGKILLTGTHVISVVANGYQSYKSEFIIEEDSTMQLSIVLKKEATANGNLHVYSNPSAVLYIDGSFQDSAPTLNLITLREGDHTLQLRRKGYKTHVETISIAAGEEKRLQINLEKE